MEPTMEPLLREYIRANRRDFYFDGDVTVTEIPALDPSTW